MSNPSQSPGPRYFLIQIEDGRKVRVDESRLIGRNGERGQWVIFDVCQVALMVDARIDGSLFADDTCRVQVGVVSGVIVEIEI